MENPFIFGVPVKGERFIDRAQELDRLKEYLRASRHVILYSPRKYGKTSLVMRAIDDLGPEITPIFIDCYAVMSERDLASRLAEAVLHHYREREILDAVKRLFSGIAPKITLKTVPEVQIEIAYRPDEDWRQSLALPPRLAMDKGRPVVVVFDEFQELAGFSGLLKELRSAFQHHDQVSYVFIGSRRHMMEWIFRAQESPFYNFGAHMTIKEIPAAEFSDYIQHRFREAGIRMDDGVVEELLALTGCHPHYTQRLAFELWYRGKVKGAVECGDAARSLDEVIAGLEESYLAIWESLTVNQRKTLLAVARGETDLFSGAFIAAHGFTSPASVQSALRKLVDKEVVTERGGTYVLADLFLLYWLERRFIRRLS